jgi:peptidoglycan/xylan/chitin deacetylase (PgdA/CDA1 family)
MGAPQIAIAFHGIGNPGRELEPGEARYWVTRDRFLQFLDLVAADPEPGRILITFDDANESDFTIAMPALQDRHLRGSFFVITERLDRPGSLGTTELRTLSRAMEVGSHGVAHVDWRKLRPERLEAELIGSKQVLEDCIGQEVTAASLPFGRYNARVLSAVHRAGYTRVFSTDGGPGRASDPLIARTNIRADTTPQDFVDLMRGQETLAAWTVRRLKALRRRFV